MWAIGSRQATTSLGVGIRVEAAGKDVAVASQGARRGRGGGGVVKFNERISSSSSRKPAVQRLSKEQLPRLLPWSGCGDRLMIEVGDLEACTARVAVSLVACALVYNTSIELASLAGFYWAWAPILSTALPNLLLRLRYGYAGIWSAQVLDVKILNPPKFVPDEKQDLLGKFFNRLPVIPSTLQLEIGDGSPATFRMEVLLSEDMPEVQAGDRVNVMVVSDEPSLSRFKCLRDLYLPDRQAWLSEEPCIEREPFERLQRSRISPVQSYGSKGGNGWRTQTQLLLEENTLSRDRASSEKALRQDYIMDDQGQRNATTAAQELDYGDIYRERRNRSPANELDYEDSYSEKRERRPAKELNYEDLYL
ncbi:unnamed protein product [Calypogeia fissa]